MAVASQVGWDGPREPSSRPQTCGTLQRPPLFPDNCVPPLFLRDSENVHFLRAVFYVLFTVLSSIQNSPWHTVRV